MRASGKGRRTLRFIDRYPEPAEILAKVTNPATDWPYKSEAKDLLRARDKALAAVLYTGALRISEARRLTISQFLPTPFQIVAVKLSKAERHDRKTGQTIIRKALFRTSVRLPTKGAKGELSNLIKQYLEMLKDQPADTRLFKFCNARANQIIGLKLGVPPHWLRAYAENDLYELWDNDLIAVANYVQVDAGTLAKYIHRVPERYLNRQ